MTEIKFRGRSIETGKVVYGDYLKGLGTVEPLIRSWKDLKYVRVKPESVAQFIGYDKNGKEVYEGDELDYQREEFQCTFTAERFDHGIGNKGNWIPAKRFNECTLKEN